MIKGGKLLQMLLLGASASVVLCLGGCSSEPQLTREELRLKKLYGRELTEDREYSVKSAGFAVRPVHEPFVQTFMRRVGTDGIEFFTEAHMVDRAPRFYAGKLSAFCRQVNMFGSPDTALANFRALVEHNLPPQSIRVLADSSFASGDQQVREFRWEIVAAGTSPLGQYQIEQGGTRNVEMLGAIIVTEDATYVAYLSENDLATYRPKSLECGDVVRVSPREASTQMGDRFRRFLEGLRFNVD